MKLSALNIEYINEKFHLHKLSWEKHGIELKRAINMFEAIEMLNNENFIIILINSDGISKFLRQLQVIRGVTNSPIHVYTSLYSAKNHANAIKYGADLFASWNENADDFIDMSLALINVSVKPIRTQKQEEAFNLPPMHIFRSLHFEGLAKTPVRVLRYCLAENP